MPGKRSKNKGKAGEREAAKEVSRILNCNAKRGVQYAGGPESPDITHDIPGVHFEVKRAERLRVWEHIEQAVADAGEENVPAVLHRKNNAPWLLILRLEDVPELCRRLHCNVKEQS